MSLHNILFVHSYAWMVIASLTWSQDLHIWMPLPNSMTLARPFGVVVFVSAARGKK